MNKKKKITRIKHRKNKDRMRKLLQASLLKAKPKKVVSTPKVEAPVETEVKESIETLVKKAPAKKTAAKKTTAKKAPAKKTAAKKTTAKKTAAKKTIAKKASAKKTAAKKD